MENAPYMVNAILFFNNSSRILYSIFIYHELYLEKKYLTIKNKGKVFISSKK